NLDECLMTRIQEMSLDYHFTVEQEVGSSTHAFFGFNAAWQEKPLAALKLICQLRGVREPGKSDREGFYAAACWMHSHHHKTLAANVTVFTKFGCLKDLPEIFLRLLQGPKQTEKRMADREAQKEKIHLAQLLNPKFKRTKLPARRKRFIVCLSSSRYFARSRGEATSSPSARSLNCTLFR
ncbi:hypothetical protein KI387_007240, partial [Taxus chinensis]